MEDAITGEMGMQKGGTIFSHGQLYLSQYTSENWPKVILLPDLTNSQTTNIVYSEIYFIESVYLNLFLFIFELTDLLHKMKVA